MSYVRLARRSILKFTVNIKRLRQANESKRPELNKRKEKGIVYHHDNVTTPDPSKIERVWFGSFNTSTIYPDIASSDYHLFRLLMVSKKACNTTWFSFWTGNYKSCWHHGSTRKMTKHCRQWWSKISLNKSIFTLQEN